MTSEPFRRRVAAVTTVLLTVSAGCAGDPTESEPAATDGLPALTASSATTAPTGVRDDPAGSTGPRPPRSTIAPKPTTVPTDSGPTTTVPSTFADRPPYPSCGRDDSLSLDGVGPSSRERQCLLDANQRGGPAELVAVEVSPLVGGAASIVYRTNADRTLDLFVAGDPWQFIHCRGLAPDPRRVFAPVDCEVPIDLD